MKTRLFSSGQVVFATFLGSPFAGAILMAKNYRALGYPRAAKETLLVGVMGTMFVLVATLNMPERAPGFIVPLCSLLVVHLWYNKTQESPYDVHVSDGGEKGTWGIVIGTGLLSCVLIVAILFAVLLVLPEG
ncbi:MAG: hypothetical protein WCN95_14505 [bacterium]